ncbi:hypothetical protein [Paraflavitalea sp. CAU 1676]|uniref:hypothetical protein n=1 Tax=Paraflavitalea sp. CAU 1676 TaxID=3032598 RepID=UPI0023DBB16E|nr:hypothetical protein [Paraflavitalea sp. CAU 1676]MDF2191879.1 hypothetical protein [Paraflavitalea sp. CAU 1676]
MRKIALFPFGLLVLMIVLAFAGVGNSPWHATPPAPRQFKWAGAWQPTRKSAADGITQLDTKIGTFITLPDKKALANVIFNVQHKFPGATPWATWAVGDLSQATPAYTNLPHATHEEWLSYMDRLGVKIYLEIFPFKPNAKKGLAASNISTMINTWLTRFKHHACVAGLGIELEYWGKASDSAAAAWDAQIKAHNPAYRLMLRHYDPGHMPPNYRGKGDLIFVDDASEGTMEELNKGFAAWANRFAPTACAFQLGYPADEDGMNGSNELGWWKLKDPIREWGQSILTQVKDANQELGFIWVTALSGKTYHQQWDLTKGAKLPLPNK